MPQIFACRVRLIANSYIRSIYQDVNKMSLISFVSQVFENSIIICLFEVILSKLLRRRGVWKQAAKAKGYIVEIKFLCVCISNPKL